MGSPCPETGLDLTERVHALALRRGGEVLVKLQALQPLVLLRTGRAPVRPVGTWRPVETC